MASKNPNEPNAPTGTGPPSAYGPSEAPQVDYSGDAGKQPGAFHMVGAPTAQPPEDLGTPSGWSYGGPLSNKPAEPPKGGESPSSGGVVNQQPRKSDAPVVHTPPAPIKPGNPSVMAGPGNDAHPLDFHGIGSKLPGMPLPAMPRIQVEGQPHIAGHPFGIVRRKRGGYHPPERMG